MLAQETSDKAHPPWLGTRGPFQFRPRNMLNHEPKPSSTCPCTSRNGTKCSTITVRFYSCFLLSLSLSRFSSVSRPGRIIREWIPSVVPSVGHPLVIIVSLVHRNCARLYVERIGSESCVLQIDIERSGSGRRRFFLGFSNIGWWIFRCRIKWNEFYKISSLRQGFDF